MKKYRNYQSKITKTSNRRKVYFGLVGGVAGILAVAGLIITFQPATTFTQKPNDSALSTDDTALFLEKQNQNPLAGKKLYVDPQNNFANLLRDGAVFSTEDGRLIAAAATQPSAIWLNGPNPGDPSASLDIQTVERTSTEANATNSVPIYQLYAIPSRDACAGYSKGGFSNNEEYLAWIERIINALQSEAIFSIEADSIAHTVTTNCLNEAEKSQRYDLLSSAVRSLKTSPKVIATYLDAGHPEWHPDPAVLVEPLLKSGVNDARGVAINVSYFAATNETVTWTQQLLTLLGENKGAVIDTSRNGNGSVSQDVDVEMRWCNPAGRAVGNKPTTDTKQPLIDGYLWIKTIGESDGNCFGHPPAGTFVVETALQMLRASSHFNE